MNDDSLQEFENNIDLLPEPPPSTNSIQLIAAEWNNLQDSITSTSNNQPSPTISNTTYKPTVKLKTPLTDINNNKWVKLPNGKWKPIPIIKTTSFDNDHNDYCNGVWPTLPRENHPNCMNTSNPLPSSPKINMIIQSTTSHKLAPTIQTDSGANICATGCKSHLHNYTPITPRKITDVNKDDNNCAEIQGYGFMYLQSINNTTTKIKVYYSPSVEDTIISPQAISSDNEHNISGWYQYANLDNNNGILGFSLRSGAKLEFNLHCHNNLWYHSIDAQKHTNNQGSVVNVLSDSQSFQLWHSRLGHPGINTMQTIHHHATGIPKLKGNAFWRCPSCTPMKLTIKKPLYEYSKRKPVKPNEINTTTDSTNKDITFSDDIFLPSAQPGQHFHMDFGFVRGKKYQTTDDEGRIITSIDGYNSYLLIIDRKTRYAWVFLTSSKHPPVAEAEAVLKKFGSPHQHKTVCTDQGKELGLSNEFKAMLARNNFNLKVTGADNSRENGRAERPHRTLAQIMRCILHSAELGPQYWSFALIHATKLYNRLPHSSIKMTPTQAFTGTKPDLSNLKIFGSRVYAKKPGRRPFKLDNHAYQGIYLGNTSTDRNVYIRDDKTGRIKIGAHVYFDEAHMTSPASKAPLAAQALQRLGYHQVESWIKDLPALQKDNNQVDIELITTTAKLPKRGTSGSIGYDVSNPGQAFTLSPGQTKVVPLDLAITPPAGSYTRIAPRSGMTVKQNITVMAGVIDPDFTGNIGAVLHNFGQKSQTIKSGQKIAQLIFENISCPKVQQVRKLKSTRRANKGFGSTDTMNASIKVVEASHTTVSNDLNLQLDLPYTINLSSNPFDYTTTRTINTNTKHPTLGLQLQTCAQYNKPKLQSCQPSTPAARLHNWRSELQNSYILKINNTTIKTMQDIISTISKAKQQSNEPITITFGTNDSPGIHPQLGVPQIYHDQLDVIGKHLWNICHENKYRKWTPVQLQEVEISNSIKQLLPRHVIRKLTCIIKSSKTVKKPKKLTRRYLQQQVDWMDWFKSEHKQLDQYEQQQTFGPPQPYPKGANLLNLLWTYLIKDDGRKKARCVCNGSPKMGGTVTLGETYAASLDQTAARIFWAVSALKNMTVIGADASNAFAEAPPPVAPLFVTIDKPFREWWKSKGRPPIPPDYVLKVKGALQGHPESPRLWAILIDRIIKDLNLTPCHHEPCLYYTKNYNNTGKTVLFLRQVDDFAVACHDLTTAQQVIHDINSKMTINVKVLGTIDRFNGVDVLQTKHYIKLYNETYINKIINSHSWLNKKTNTSTYPIPMPSDPEYRKSLENAIPATATELKQLEKEYGFKYRQGVGEILYAMVTCRPDISFPTVKLSQYSVAPAPIHFEALKSLYIYLKATKSDGIYYWRPKPREDLPMEPLPTTKPETAYNNTTTQQHHQSGHTLFSAADSDHATDSRHRKSVSGIIHMLAGGTIHYKSKYQDVIATSTGEAEFIAAAEAGKQILYIRSILQTIGIPQQAATTLFEDNQGALLMANAQKPTKRTKHMDIRHFALQDWVNRDLITLKRIETMDNYSDAMTKPLARTLFYRHMDFIQGKMIPPYAQCYNGHFKREHRKITPAINQLIFNLSSIQTQSVLKPRFRTGEEVT